MLFEKRKVVVFIFIRSESTQMEQVYVITSYSIHYTKLYEFETPVKDAYLSLTGEAGLDGRSTACARGNGMLEIRNSPYRITQPLKRVGKRGEGRWQPISYEQLLEEIVEGGDLFGVV